MLTERTSYFFGASGSMLLHMLVIAAALIVARPDLERRQFVRPEIIHARLVELEARNSEPTVAQERVVDLTRRQPPPPAPAPRPTIPVQQSSSQPAEPRLEDQPAQQNADGARGQELTPISSREQNFTMQLQAEAAALAAQADQEQVVSVGALIKQKVEANWNRPANARNGMVVELRVNLQPNGRVTNVEVVNSSGDTAFDRSADQAVRKAEPFNWLQDLPSRVFEENFRTFRFRFSPDDLRL